MHTNTCDYSETGIKLTTELASFISTKPSRNSSDTFFIVTWLSNGVAWELDKKTDRSRKTGWYGRLTKLGRPLQRNRCVFAVANFNSVIVFLRESIVFEIFWKWLYFMTAKGFIEISALISCFPYWPRLSHKIINNGAHLACDLCCWVFCLSKPVRILCSASLRLLIQKRYPIRSIPLSNYERPQLVSLSLKHQCALVFC